MSNTVPTPVARRGIALIALTLLVAHTGMIAAQEPSFLVEPYLQLGHVPARDSLVVLWHAADRDADWSVEIRTAEGGPWRKADTPTARRIAVPGIEPHRVYRARLAGLEPGGRFRYVVSKDSRVVFSSEGRAPKAPDQSYRVLVFGDCGAGSEEQKALAGQACLARPDLVVIPGDIVYEDGTIRDYRATFWSTYNAEHPSSRDGPLLRSTPAVAAPGNHDVADSSDLDKFPDGLAYFYYWDQPLNGPAGVEGGPFVPAMKASEANRRAFLEGAGEAYPRMANFSFDYGNAHWTFIDSNTYVDWTDPTLKSWVTNDLAAARDATLRFVVFHHAAFNSAREHYEQQQMRLLAPLFEEGKVDLAFSGHVHNYQRTFPLRFIPDKQGTLLIGGRDGKTIRGRVVNGRWRLDKTFDGRSQTTPDGVIYVVTGAGGKDLYNPEQQDDPDSWQKYTDRFVSKVHSMTVLDVDGKSLTLRQVDANGQEIDRFSITK
jgi:3',5'-cyclic AMP phosphodiesterase CpdA